MADNKSYDKGERIQGYDERINAILEVMLRFTQSDFSQKATISDAGDELDALAVGLNTMSEELESHIHQLKASEEQIQTIFKNAPDAVIVIDSEGKIAQWNLMAEKIFGWEREEVIGKHLHEVIIPERFREAHTKGMKHFLQTGEGPVLNKPIELPALRKDNSEFQTELSISPYQFKGKYFFIGFVKDITERKKAEDRLKESEEKFNKAFAASPAGILITRLSDQKYIDVNNAMVEMMGIPKEEFIGRTSVEMGIIMEPEVRQKALEQINNYGYFKNLEMDIKHKSGRAVHILISAYTVLIHGEKHAINVVYDITEKKQAEDQLKKRTEELAISNQDLEQFAYIASHDLQEPLRMVTSFLQLLEKHLDKKLDKDGKEYMAFAVDGSRRMKSMIEDLLSYSRIMSRKIELEKVDLNELLEDALQDLREKIKDTNAKIVCKKLPSLTIDKIKFTRLFLNLIGNAIKFSRTGVTPTVEIAYNERGDEYLFWVKDNGIGINKDYEEKIFMLFQRLNPIGQYEGTGIGLAECKKIVEMHGGKIWVESEMEKGSVFYFTIRKINPK